MNLEEELRWWRAGLIHVAGMDEAGRGPLAGPVVAAAVIFDSAKDITSLAADLRDSKQLSKKQREELFPRIIEHALAYSYACISNTVIDSIGILNATKRAMRTSLRSLTTPPDMLLTDALSINLSDIPIPQKAIVHGDARIASIAAASIIAKVKRDIIMERYAKQYTTYTFHAHKGYCTRAHLRELKKSGPTPIHRRSFEPVKQCE